MTKSIAKQGLDQETAIATGTLPLPPLVIEGLAEFAGSFDRLCLKAGIAAIETLLAGDVEALCGPRYERRCRGRRRGHRWGRTASEIGWHGGKAVIERPRVRAAGREVELPSWRALQEADLLSQWSFNQMLIGVATRKYERSVRLPESDVTYLAGRGMSKSAVSRRFVALSAAQLDAWLSADLSDLDLLVIQIDGLRLGPHVMVAALGIDSAGEKHVLALVEGATENSAVVKALLADLIERGLKPDVARLFIVDGAKALTRAIRDTFGRLALIQRCQVHKGRNIVERLPKSMHASVKQTLRQARDVADADHAERLMRNLARRLDQQGYDEAARSLLEGLDEILTVVRLGLPEQLRRALGCTNGIESMIAVIRHVCRNVKRWRGARMARRWTGTAMREAAKGFRRLKGHRHLPKLEAALARHQQKVTGKQAIAGIADAA
jgi:transposase-like protein